MSALSSSTKSVGLGWDENRVSHYNIRAEGALPPSMTVIERMVNLGYGICNVFSYEN